VNPTLRTCTELVRRGHAVHYYCGEAFRGVVEATGAEFHTVDYAEIERVMVEDPTNVARMLPSAVRMAREFLSRHGASIAALEPDLMLYDNTCFWAYDLALRLGVPTVSSFSIFVMDPAALRTVPEFKMLSPLSMLLRGNPLRQAAGFLSFRREYRAYLAENGFERRPLSALWNNEGEANLVYTVRDLQPGGAALGERYHFIGPVPRAEESGELHLPPGDAPLVYVSLGTLPHDMTEFLQSAVDAIEECGFRGVVATGRGVAPETIHLKTDSVTLAEFVPQLQVLEETTVFVSHGGMNSTHESLARGVPLAFLPRQEEQQLIASRVVERGAGILLPPGTTSTSELADAIRALAGDPQYRQAAEALSATFAEAWEEPADVIEELLTGETDA
jgi:hypothetical protein